EVQVEGIMCPNCKEEVPKTLYCLNCGYPLYKISMDADKPEEEDSIPVVKEKVEIDEGVAIVVDSFEAPVVEEVAFEPIEEPAAVIELPAPFIVEESPAVEVEPSEATVEAIEVSEKLEVEEEEPVGTIEFSEPTEIFVEAAESNEPEEIIEAEEPEEIIEAEEPEEKAAVEEKVVVKEEAVIEMEYVFEPEPVTREVMENLAKNVSLKIKLVDLLLKGEVKMVTFERLFDNYVARSKLLLNSRSEMLVRVRFDLESREKALNEAKIGLEELGIRRSIGDVSEEEYRAKSPGFEWDIGQYRDDVDYKRAEIEYLENLTELLSREELEDLREKGESSHETIETLVDSGVMSSEMSERIK
ncbi:hypothetical protein MCGE09_00650, partial [Thaumarchaeota archaeon SCGC AB-539-E09]